jgi:CBS-domain-containing membrane protein
LDDRLRAIPDVDADQFTAAAAGVNLRDDDIFCFGRIPMRAEELMTMDVVTARPETEVSEVAWRLVKNRVSALPVVDADRRILGIISEGDLMRRPDAAGTERHPSWWLSMLADPKQRAREYVKAHGRRAKDVMTREVITVSPDTPMEEIAKILEKHHIKRVPVLRDGELVGIVSRANLLRGLIARKAAGPASGDDTSVRRDVLKSIEDSGVRNAFIDVVVAGGVAQLWGAAESDDEKDAVRVAASNTPGVGRVENNISVFPQFVRATIGAE